MTSDHAVINANPPVTDRPVEDLLREREQQYRSIFESTGDGLIIVDPETATIIEANPAVCRMHGYTREEFLGLHRKQFIHPGSWSDLADYLAAIGTNGECRLRAMDVRKDGTPFYVDVHGSSITYEGKPAILAVVRDVTEQVRAWELLEQRVTERTHELETILEVGRTVVSTLELQPLLETIGDQLRRVVEYEALSILRLQGDTFEMLANRRPPDVPPVTDFDAERVEIDWESPLWEPMQGRGSIIIADVRGNDPYAIAYREMIGPRFTTQYQHVRSWMGVPMIVGDRVIGALVLSMSRPDFYAPHHATLAEAIANHAAIAIENAQLLTHARRAAVLDERQRLARELHDSISQALFGIGLGAQTALSMLERDPERAIDPVRYVLELADAGLAEMRSLIFELRPESLESEGLVKAIEKQAAAIRARHRLAVELRLDGEPDVSIEVKEAIYRIAQEAMHNSVKHANARTILVEMACHNGVVRLHVADDGRGFDPSQPFPGHLGMRSMPERARALGGSFDIRSQVGDGTHVRVTIPIRSSTPTR